MSSNLLLNLLFEQPDKTLYAAVEQRLAGGDDPNFTTSFGETPLLQAFRRGRMDVVALLLEHGADVSRMRWGPVHIAVALGDAEAVRGAVAAAGDMSARDVSGLTPFLLACDIGDVEKAAVLLPLSNREDRFATYHRQPALVVAASKGRSAVVRWLLANGFDVNEADEFGLTALMEAAEQDWVEVVKILLEAGADVDARYNLSDVDLTHLGIEPLPPDILADDHISIESAASKTTSAAVARLLIDSGMEPHEFSNCVLRELTGAALIPARQVAPAAFEAQKHRRFGTKNPESVTHEFWLEMIRTGESGYGGHLKYGKMERDYSAPPVWCFDRFGMSTTELPTGSWVQIAGEHEDYYDPDFCIYNDVVVHDGKGNAQIYIYPADVFPPTDFHTATLVGDAIILIGNLGYPENRQVGYTQVLHLDLNNYSVHLVKTCGDVPGWISKHRAQLDGDLISVREGMVWTGDDLVPMPAAYELNLEAGVWRRLDKA